LECFNLINGLAKWKRALFIANKKKISKYAFLLKVLLKFIIYANLFFDIQNMRRFDVEKCLFRAVNI